MNTKSRSRVERVKIEESENPNIWETKMKMENMRVDWKEEEEELTCEEGSEVEKEEDWRVSSIDLQRDMRIFVRAFFFYFSSSIFAFFFCL